MRAQQERTVRDLYDRTRHKDLAAPEESAEGRGGGRAAASGHLEVASKMEDKIVRKSSDTIHLKAESGTCNVCYAPCSSCLHRSLTLEDSNVDCGSSQTCSTRSKIKNNSLIRSEKGLRIRGGEIDDNFSAASSDASYSEAGGNKVAARSSIAEDSSEDDMPAKRRKLFSQDARTSKAELHDDSNSCVSGISVEGKRLLDKKKLSTSASSRDLTVRDSKDNSIATYNRLRNPGIGESSARKGSDVHVMHPSSSCRLVPADSPSAMTKKLLRTQSCVSVSKGLSPKGQAHELGRAQDSLSHQPCEKASLTNDNIEHSVDEKLNPCVVGSGKHGMLEGCCAGNRNENKAGFSPKDLENGTTCSKDEIQEDAAIQSNNDTKRNAGDKQDWDQDCPMDISGDGKLDTQNDVMADCGNSEGLIDVNVCDICGDVGKEYLLATCTRCLEGAEHTYCMRVKLDKVPDGEWLCEECQLQEDESKKRRNYGVTEANISEGKNQSSESRCNPKLLHVVVPNPDPPQITCSTPTADQCDVKTQKLASADTQARQVKITTPAAERLDLKNKNMLSMANRKKLHVVTSDLEARPHTNGTLTPGSSNKKNQSSEFWLKHKKLRVSTNMESPPSREGLRSPPVSCKRQAENTLSSNPRLIKTTSLRKHDVVTRETSVKKSSKGSLNAFDNAPVRTTQAVKSSQTLSRSYSLGSMVNAKAPVPSPRGPLSKQLSFNSSNSGPKVKQLTEGIANKLRPLKHSPRDTTDKGPIKKFMKSGSFKFEGSVCKDASSSKQKQSFHLSQDEKPGMSKPMKEKNLIEKRPSFSFRKPNIPLSPRLDSSTRPDERKTDQDITRSGPSILKSGKKPGNVEKKQSTVFSKSDKQDVAVHRKPVGVVSSKDTYTVKISDPPVPSQCVRKDSSNDGEDADSFVAVHRKPVGVVSSKDTSTVKISDPPVPSQCVRKDSTNDGEDVDSFVSVKNGNGMPTEPPVELPTTCAAMTCESDLPDIVPRASASEDSASKVVCCQQKPLESTENGACKIVEVPQALEDILPESPCDLQVAHNLHPTVNRLYTPNLKQEACVDQSSTLKIPSRDLVIPEQSYIWQGSLVVSRHENSLEMFDGIQAYLSACASPKVRELGKQLPNKIQLAEVPRNLSWPLQFKEVNPTEDNIALFFFAKDVESYESAYGKLLENMLLGDLSLTANIGGTELLIFPSDQLPERAQRWNGLLFFWGVFCARRASRSSELPVTGTSNCPLEPIAVPDLQHDVCSPKVPQSLGIDLNECPNDDLCDPVASFGSEMEKYGGSIDHNTLESKHEDMNACEIHHEGTAGTGQIVLGRPTATPFGSHFPTTSTGEGRDMMQDYPNGAKGTTGTAGRRNMEEEGFCQDVGLFCVAQQAGAIRSISDDMMAKKQALMPSVEISSPHLSGSKTSHDSRKLISKSDMGILESYSSKRQKTSHGKPSSCSFGDEQPVKCLSKIHPFPAGQHNPSDDVQYIYRGPSVSGTLKKAIPDHVIHVLSSDDEDSPEPSTSLNKASLKADEGSSPLLSLSLSTLAVKHNLAGSDIGEDEPLPLSLGLPDVVEGSRALEMKQFLPEKPGINT
ncbi:hypothetical protein ACP70R_020832 [Stipagrostis hirtigluma subsp. patula]